MHSTGAQTLDLGTRPSSRQEPMTPVDPGGAMPAQVSGRFPKVSKYFDIWTLQVDPP